MMINININGQQTSTENGSTILDVAKSLDIKIPTLCHYKGSNASCMICVVHDLKSDKLVPSCTMPVQEGMQIETENDKVKEARKDTIDLLLSEHIGDCMAPCQKSCPAGMDIPLMIRQIKENDLKNALITIKQDIALPAVLGRICSAPCEGICNRRFHDEPVSICNLKRHAADADLAEETQYTPEIKQDSGKIVAVVGAGPAGLSAAYYIRQFGHNCTIFDSNSIPGGEMQYSIPDNELPKAVLQAEIEQILSIGIELKSNKTLGTDFSFKDLTDEYDVVVLAMGAVDPKIFEKSGIILTSQGIKVNRKTFETDIAGVFAGGNAISKSKMAIRSSAHGKFIANSVDQFLAGKVITTTYTGFNSVLGKLHDGESNEFLKGVGKQDRIIPADSFNTGFTSGEAVDESDRCFHCDCRKLTSCKLRQYSEEFGGDQKRFRIGPRKDFQKIVRHDLINFEPGKCIKCGICVDIAKGAGEELGLAFVNRGFDVQITVPFNESIENGLKKVGKECVDACPTAALAWRKNAD